MLFCWPSGKDSALRTADLGSIPTFAVDLFPVRVIPVTSELVFQWILCQVPKRVSTGTGWPGVSILWEGVTVSLISNFHLHVAAHTIVWADPSLRYTSLLLGLEATNLQPLFSVLWGNHIDKSWLDEERYCQQSVTYSSSIVLKMADEEEADSLRNNQQTKVNFLTDNR